MILIYSQIIILTINVKILMKNKLIMINLKKEWKKVEEPL